MHSGLFHEHIESDDLRILNVSAADQSVFIERHNNWDISFYFAIFA
jgi:hypothetical protein